MKKVNELKNKKYDDSSDEESDNVVISNQQNID